MVALALALAILDMVVSYSDGYPYYIYGGYGGYGSHL
jgi:hypothetical protein